MMTVRRFEIEDSLLNQNDTARQKTSWDFICNQINSELGDTAFKTWFLKCEGIVENNHLTIICPNRFVSDFIELNFKNQINDVVSKLNISWGMSVGFSKSEPVNKSTEIKTPINDNVVQQAEIMSSLNPEFSWDNFVQSQKNDFAISACKKVASESNCNYSLLYLYGPEGAGKTHLLNSMAYTASQNRRVLIMSASSFSNDFIRACNENTIFDFKDKIRDCDVLIIDSIDELSTRTKSKLELMQAICDILEKGGQVVISSSYSPSALTGFDKKHQLVLSSGLSVELYSPDSAVCEQLFIKKGIPSEMARYISNNIKLNGHIITGIIKKLNAWTEITGKDLDYDTVNNLLHDVMEEQTGPADLVKSMCKILSVSYDDICSNRRFKSLVRARYLIMAVLKQKTDLSLESIGKLLGNRDHATVLYGIDQINNDKDLDFSLMMDYENLMKNTQKLS